MSSVAISAHPDVVSAIVENRLSSWAQSVIDNGTDDDHVLDIANRSLQACTAIRTSVEADGEELSAALRSAGIDSTIVASDQHHSLRVRIDPASIDDAHQVLVATGYETTNHWQAGAHRSFRRFASEAIYTRAGTRSTVIRVRWGTSAAGTSRLRGSVRRVVVPTPADWATVALPRSLWWAYSVVRPFRIAAERLGIVSDAHGDLEPFLVTPNSLLAPLLDFADVDESDVFADIGCGDGRIVVAAAVDRGCRAIGVEQSADAASAARRRAAEASVSERVRIIEGDAADADLSDVTAAMFFVPMSVAVQLLPAVLRQLPVGGRLLLHEQAALDDRIPRPTTSAAIVTANAVTVAHLWTR